MPRLLRLSDVRATAEGTQPPGYRLRGRGHLNLGLLSVLSLVALPVALIAFALITAPLGGPLKLGGSFAVAIAHSISCWWRWRRWLCCRSSTS